MPFVQIKMALAAGHKTTRSYPAFDPLAVFAEDGAAQTASSGTTGQIYGVKVESEMSLKTVDFPIETAAFDEKSGLSADEVEKVVRETGAILTDGAVQVAALHYIDPQRFGDIARNARRCRASYGVRIVPENVSVTPRAPADDQAVAFAEDIIPFNTDRNIVEAFAESGYAGDDAIGMARGDRQAAERAEALKAGTVLRVGLEVHGDVAKVVRTSVYDRTRHLVSIALDDRGQFVPATEPEPNPELLTAFDDSPPVAVRGNLPTVYDGIYRAAYSYGMSRTMTRQLVKLLASDVDFQSRLKPSDRSKCSSRSPTATTRCPRIPSFSTSRRPSAATRATSIASRCRTARSTISTRTAAAPSSSCCAIPLPNGQFRSGFGGRRHPILGYTRMHTGVDWAAPSGTPIIAAGNGVVEKAGWAGGYGKQTIIRHANGYETSYNHQSRIAKGIKPGARVARARSSAMSARPACRPARISTTN